MNEQLVVLSFTLVNPNNAAGLGDNDFYHNVPCDCMIVYVCASSDTDDTSQTVDINDDGTGIIETIDSDTKADPGEWISTHCGGTETPVRVAVGSELSFDVNSGANDTTVHLVIWLLTSAVWA
jgi:hypothetical protein